MGTAGSGKQRPRDWTIVVGDVQGCVGALDDLVSPLDLAGGIDVDPRSLSRRHICGEIGVSGEDVTADSVQMGPPGVLEGGRG